MLADLFRGLFDTDMTQVITPGDFLLCVGSALIIGVLLAGFYMYRSRYTKSFVATLALLPGVVCVIIMMVNGNVGTGVAVAGAFSLVRFRSVPGSAKEIGAIFLAMGTGRLWAWGIWDTHSCVPFFWGLPVWCLTGWTLVLRKRHPCIKLCTSPSRRIWTTPMCSSPFGRSTPLPVS